MTLVGKKEKDSAVMKEGDVELPGLIQLCVQGMFRLGRNKLTPDRGVIGGFVHPARSPIHI